MNKRIAIRRLDATPTTHSFTLYIKAYVDEGDEMSTFEKVSRIDITEYDNLVKVMNHICSEFSYTIDESTYKKGGLGFDYNNATNKLELYFINSRSDPVNFCIKSYDIATDNDLLEFLKFLNQPYTRETTDLFNNVTEFKIFHEVWNRDRLHFHASFSTSRRKFIGKRGDFYQNLTLLYPPPTNESTFYIRMTSNGIKNILLRYCEFDVQLCFIVNYKNGKAI